MAVANQEPKGTPKNDDLRQFLWLPLSLSGTGSALGAVILVAAGFVHLYEKWELLLFPVLVSGVSILYTWFVPDIRSEARLAWGSLPQRMVAALVRLVKGAVFGTVAGLVGSVPWFLLQIFTLV